jgi:beta-glucosidase-like glycosyl hydrolase
MLEINYQLARSKYHTAKEQQATWPLSELAKDKRAIANPTYPDQQALCSAKLLLT